MGEREPIFKSMANMKGKWVILGAAALAIALLLFGGRGTDAKDAAEEDTFVATYTEMLEERVEALVGSMDGIEHVEVLLTLECGSELVYAENTGATYGESGLLSSSGEYIILSSGGEESGLFLKEIYPRVRGIAVVCSGGNDTETQRAVTELLSVAFGISSARISVSGK